MSDTESVYKRCSCEAEFTKEEFELLGFVGLSDAEENGDKRIELRNCNHCGSTIGVEHAQSLTSQRAGYACEHGQPVQLIQGAAITLCWQCPRDTAKVKYRPFFKVTETSDQQIKRVLEDHSEPHEIQEKY